MKLGTLVAVNLNHLEKVLGKVVERGISEEELIIATPSGVKTKALRSQLEALDKDKNQEELNQLRMHEQDIILKGIFPLYGRNLVLDEGFYPDNYME